MKLSLEIEDSLHKKFKVITAIQGVKVMKTLEHILEEGIKKYLDEANIDTQDVLKILQ